MTADQSLVLWNTHWTLLEEAVVCSGCQRKQTLRESDQPFDHGSGCSNIKDTGTAPWADLHDILDVARG